MQGGVRGRLQNLASEQFSINQILKKGHDNYPRPEKDNVSVTRIFQESVSPQ
jgi:hypothetical protein